MCGFGALELGEGGVRGLQEHRGELYEAWMAVRWVSRVDICLNSG